MEEALVRARTGGLGTVVQGREIPGLSLKLLGYTHCSLQPLLICSHRPNLPVLLSTTLPSCFRAHIASEGSTTHTVSFRPQLNWVLVPRTTCSNQTRHRSLPPPAHTDVGRGGEPGMALPSPL